MLYVNLPTLPNVQPAAVRTFTNATLSVQELAQLALNIKSGNVSQLEISKFENAAFKSFINKKVGNNSLISARICKGCHGG